MILKKRNFFYEGDNMYKIAIVDDEKSAIETLETHLKKFQEENPSLELNVRTFLSPDEFFEHENENFDLLFLDVEMPEMSGFVVAERLREKYSEIAIIFITNMAQYAIKGYSVEALDYVLKPVGYYAFSMKMKKAITYMERHSSKEIPIKLGESEFINVSVRDILYVEVLLHYIVYHTKEREFKVRGSMNEAEKTLKPYAFARIGKSFLVNMRSVKGVNGMDITLKNGEVLKLSRSKKEEFLTQFFAFMGNLNG